MTNRDVKLGRYVGEPVTVTDAKGVNGVGAVSEVRPSGSFKVIVPFRHTDADGVEHEPRCWFFFSDERDDYGLKIAFRLVEAPADQGSLQPSPSVPGEGHGTGVVAKAVSEIILDLKLRGYAALDGDPHWVTEGRAWDAIIARHFTPPAASVSMGTSRKASEPIQGVNAELLECLKTVRDYVSDRLTDAKAAGGKSMIDMVSDDLARIDAAIATATRNSGDEG